MDAKKVIIWGRSVSGLDLFVKLKSNCSANIMGFTDSFVKKENLEFAGLPVYGIEQLEQMKDVFVFISTVNSEALISIFELIGNHNLMNCQFITNCEVWGPGEYDIPQMNNLIEKEKFKIEFVRYHLEDDESKRVYDNLIRYRQTNDAEYIKESFEQRHKQYFPGDDIFEKSEDEIFLDAGAYDGRTSFDFSEWVHGCYKKIYALEADETMFKVCKEFLKLKKLENVVVKNCAAYSENQRLCFTQDYQTGSSSVCSNGESLVQGVKIDDVLCGEPVTYIKMDIEGAEMEALIGCKKSIEKYHPKLAISIYHKENDLWEIPFYLSKQYPFYKFYIRHYTDITTETILYAVER